MKFDIMNKTILKVLTFAAGLAGLASCETYTVDDPETTAVSEFDGRWVCFAYPKDNPSEPEDVYMIDIFNTTNNDADKFWIRVINCAPKYSVFLDCLQFQASCDGKALTFQANDVDAEQPKACYNWIYEQGYPTAGYRGYVPATGYKASVTGGKILKNSVETAAKTKVDGIELSYKRVEPDGSVSEYTIKGMKNTGWAEDLQEYIDFMDENY